MLGACSAGRVYFTVSCAVELCVVQRMHCWEGVVLGACSAGACSAREGVVLGGVVLGRVVLGRVVLGRV